MLTFSADSTSVSAGETALLSWSSRNTEQCRASGAWSGTKPTKGTFRTPALEADASFTLSCSGKAGGALATVRVQVGGANNGGDGDTNGPTVSLSSSQGSVAPQGTTELRWNATGAQRCEASGPWSGVRPTSGQERVGPLSSDATFKLTCTGSGGTAIAMTEVVIRQATLRWEPPAGENTADLRGYRLQWGTAPGEYSRSLDVNDPSARSRTIELANHGTYYFALNAIDKAGAIAGRSNEASKEIPP